MRMRFSGLATALAGLAVLALATPVMAAENMSTAALQAQFKKDVAGKTIIYIPVSYSVPLTRIWGLTMQKDAKALGIKFEVRDPDFNTQREEQLLEGVISQHPDLLIVHNPNVQVLASALQRAERAGIYVIQINMASRYKTDAFVGVQPVELGTEMATAVVNACSSSSAPSHEVALMDGEVTSAYSIGITEGAMAVFKKNPTIKIVSNQAANWDSKAAHDKAATVLQAHPKLCAYMGYWSGQDVGIAQAVKQAGLLDKVKIITTDGGEPPACQYLKDGLFYEDFSYQAKAQANQMMAVAEFLLQSHMKPGTFHTAVYSPVAALTKANVRPGDCASLASLK
jgi:ribose transport system substrate-binding protein